MPVLYGIRGIEYGFMTERVLHMNNLMYVDPRNIQRSPLHNPEPRQIIGEWFVVFLIKRFSDAFYLKLFNNGSQWFATSGGGNILKTVLS